MAKHEFGIIDSFEEKRWYSDYEPEKYNCISVDDDLIGELTVRYDEELTEINTYFAISTQVGKGLDYSGVTIIPPESLKQFRNVIIEANDRLKSKELQLLKEKITEAIMKNMHLIHYGI